MKQRVTKIISAVCAAAMLSGGLAMLPVQAAEVQSARIMGDVNGDLRVTIEDAKKILDASVSDVMGLSGAISEELYAGDIDMNGVIEMTDALAVMRYFCQTLVGDQPLWSEVRQLTYHDGTEYDPDYHLEDNVPQEGIPFEKRGMYMELGCAEGKPGEQVEIPVYLAGIAEFSFFGLAVVAPEGVNAVSLNPALGLTGFGENGIEVVVQPTVDLGDIDWIGSTALNGNRAGYGWNSLEGLKIDVKDGVVIASVTYQIPEDAKAGDLFVVTVDPKATSVNTVHEDGELLEFPAYQYTLLDGVIAVK